MTTFALSLRRLYSKSSKPRAGRIVRKERSNTAPFEGQWASATQRHRDARRNSANEDETDNQGVMESSRSAILDTDGLSQTHQQSATYRHRQSRQAVEYRSGLPSSGSVTASLSATNQHRRRRAAAGTVPRVSPSFNPSEVSIAVDPQDAAEQAKRFERVEEVVKKDDPPKSSRLVYVVGASVAALVAVGASGIVGLEDLAVLAKTMFEEVGLDPKKS